MLLNVIVKSIKRKSHRGDQSVVTDQITTDIIACVNEALREVVRMIPKQFFFKQSTVAVTAGVAGTPAVYSLASDVQEPIAFWYTSNGAFYKVNKINSDREWFSGVWDPVTPINLPYHYREIGPDSSGYKQIELFPIPNSSITLNYEYYRTKTTDLDSNDVSEELPDLPDYVQDVVEKGALYYFLKGFDDPAGEVAKRDFEQAKLDYENADEKNADTLPALRFQRKRYFTPGFRLDE